MIINDNLLTNEDKYNYFKSIDLSKNKLFNHV